MSKKQMEHVEEPWWNWKPLAAFVYLFICLVDFIVMPVLTYRLNTNIIETILALDDDSLKLELAKLITTPSWNPVTLDGGGLFHLAFGAILAGVAVTGGIVHTAIVNNNRKTHGKDS